MPGDEDDGEPELGGRDLDDPCAAHDGIVDLGRGVFMTELFDQPVGVETPPKISFRWAASNSETQPP